MAKLKNILLETLKNNSDFDNALENLSQAQQNILKNYSNPVFSAKNQEKLLKNYSALENIGKAIYRQKALVENGIDTDKETTALLKGGISNTRYIWHSENGENTCEACKALDGTTYDFEDKVPERPHPNCRCTVEIVEDATDNTIEPCDCYEQIQKIYQQAQDLENELLADMDEMEDIVNEVESDYQEYLQLYDIASSLKDDVENLEPCSENCVAITGFAIDLSNDEKLGDIYYNLIKDIEPARESYRIFEYNKKLMEEDIANVHIDKYYHAKANCESAELGKWYALWATIHSVAKEIKDYIKKVYKDKQDAKKIFEDCMQDLKADILGLLKAREHGYCADKVLDVENKFPRY